MSDPTGYPPGYGYGEPNLNGIGYELACEASEFGVPVGWNDPLMYHGTEASRTLSELDPQINVYRSL